MNKAYTAAKRVLRAINVRTLIKARIGGANYAGQTSRRSSEREAMAKVSAVTLERKALLEGMTNWQRNRALIEAHKRWGSLNRMPTERLRAWKDMPRRSPQQNDI